MHYHEVYFNEHTSDGPRVGATRRHKGQILSERIQAKAAGRFVHPGAEIVRCDRADCDCPWTVDGVPGETPVSESEGARIARETVERVNASTSASLALEQGKPKAKQ